jgi:hypothetical protein
MDLIAIMLVLGMIACGVKSVRDGRRARLAKRRIIMGIWR